MAEKSDKPIYFFRFEDVMTKPREELQNLMKFILGIDDIKGTVIEQRIEEVLAMGSASNRVYTPRAGGMNKNLQNYSQEQLDYVRKTNEEILHYFGYVDDGREDNNTPIFDFRGKEKPNSLKVLNRFKEMNKRAVELRK